MLIVLFRSRPRLANTVAIALILVGGIVWWGYHQATEAPALAGHQDAGVVLLTLFEQGSTVTAGWISLTARGNDTEVVIHVLADTPASRVAHIHQGQCDPSLGEIVYGLTNIVDGTSTTLLQGVSLAGLLTGNLGINTHLAQDPTLPTGCASIPADGAFVTMVLNELNSSGQSGWATLTARGNDTGVVFSLSKGALESRVTHLHVGQCDPGLGDAIVGLSNVVDGVSISLLEGRPLGGLLALDLGINTHSLQDQSISTTCGDVRLRAGLQLYFTVVAVNQATEQGLEHRLVLDGHGTFTGGAASGGGSFVHFNDSAGTIPRPILSSGRWRVKELVNWTPQGGSYGGITPGVLDLLVELIPENRPVISGVSLRIVCNVGPAGLVNIDSQTGSALAEGFVLTVPKLSFYPEPFGPFEPIISEGGLPFGLTTIGRVQDWK